MEKLFVSCEIAKRMQKLGFDEPCLAYYYGDEFITCPVVNSEFIPYTQDFKSENPVAPLTKQAFDWILKSTEYLIEPSIKRNVKGISDFLDSYWYHIYNLKTRDTIISELFETYEKAEQSCLEKLIILMYEN